MHNNTAPKGLSTSTVSSTGAITTTATVAALPGRKYGYIQNQTANALFIKFGTGCTNTDYHVVLGAASGAATGNVAAFAFPPGYEGPVTVAGTSYGYSVVEFT